MEKTGDRRIEFCYVGNKKLNILILVGISQL